ncbi:MAG: glycosyltransferase family 9 protein [Draconibacterium sp.]
MKNIGIITWGGLGDVLLITPALRSIKKESTNTKINVFCDPFHEPVLRNNPHIDRLILTGPGVAKKELRQLFRKMDNIYRTEYATFQPSILNKKHATVLIAEMLGFNIDKLQLDIYLDKCEENVAHKIVSKLKFPVAICVNSTHHNKDWNLESWKRLVKEANYVDFIQLGLPEDYLIEGCIDLRGKTTLREAFAIVKLSKLLIAVDSLWNHVSNAVETKGIILWGPGNHLIWGYENNINISKECDCSPCIDLHIDDCTKNKCMDLISVNDILLEMNKILKNNA